MNHNVAHGATDNRTGCRGSVPAAVGKRNPAKNRQQCLRPTTLPSGCNVEDRVKQWARQMGNFHPSTEKKPARKRRLLASPRISMRRSKRRMTIFAALRQTSVPEERTKAQSIGNRLRPRLYLRDFRCGTLRRGRASTSARECADSLVKRRRTPASSKATSMTPAAPRDVRFDLCSRHAAVHRPAQRIGKILRNGRRTARTGPACSFYVTSTPWGLGPLVSRPDLHPIQPAPRRAPWPAAISL